MTREDPADASGLVPQLVDECCRGSASSVEPDQALARLLDREALRDLVNLYAFAVDDHDLATLATMFHPEAVFDLDGQMASGWSEIAAALGASMRGFRAMVHTPEAHVVRLTGADAAEGVAAGHGELVTSRGVVLAAYRYRDAYARLGGRWVFARRTVRFRYAVSAPEYARTLPEPDPVRFPGEDPRASAVRPVAAGS